MTSVVLCKVSQSSRLKRKSYDRKFVTAKCSTIQSVSQSVNKSNTHNTSNQPLFHFQQLLYDNNETNENTNFANNSDETENLPDDEILGKLTTPKELHEHSLYRNLRQRKKATWILF